MEITLFVNNEEKKFNVKAADRLLDVLRKNGYKGVKKGCGEGECGSCTVLLNGKAVNSCMILAVSVAGEHITTIDGIGTMDNPHPIQKRIVETGGVQCGFCTPGFILSSYALLEKKKNPSLDDIKHATDGNYCRCTGYVKMIEAVADIASPKKGAIR